MNKLNANIKTLLNTNFSKYITLKTLHIIFIIKEIENKKS